MNHDIHAHFYWSWSISIFVARQRVGYEKIGQEHREAVGTLLICSQNKRRKSF